MNTNDNRLPEQPASADIQCEPKQFMHAENIDTTGPQKGGATPPVNNLRRDELDLGRYDRHWTEYLGPAPGSRRDARLDVRLVLEDLANSQI